MTVYMDLENLLTVKTKSVKPVIYRGHSSTTTAKIK